MCSVIPLMRQLGEQVTIQRQDKDDRRFVDTIAQNVNIVIAPTRKGDTILPTGEVLRQPSFQGMLFEKNDDIEEGDIIMRANVPAERAKLFVHRVLPYGDHMQLELDENMK